MQIVLFLTTLLSAADAGVPESAPPTPPNNPAATSAPAIPSPNGLVPGSCGDSCCPNCWNCCPDPPPSRFWARGEYLLWFTEGASLPPLVTASPVGTSRDVTGVLGLSSTKVLFGDSRVEGDERSGARFTLGVWLDDEQSVGIVGDFFVMSPTGIGFRAASAGDPNLNRPFFNVLLDRPDAELVSFPGVLSGAVAVTGSSSFCGGSLDGRSNLAGGCNYRIDGLAGYRYLRLTDKLNITEDLLATSTSGAAVAGTRFNILDRFGTENDFHGGEVGITGEVRRDALSLEFVGKIALGATYETGDVNGNTVTRVPGLPPSVGTGGLLALTSNIGHHECARLAVVPELGVNLGYTVGPALRVFVGYSWIYCSDVIHAGSQIDPIINTSGLPPNMQLGTIRPAFIFHSSDYWAQGLDVGLELRF